ncbi:hypothetical protein DPMN_170031 [Dreissena polymorpha]|uniref:Uncharacterized protein n=1 Tax=Dreissena polymorpha TaxID=45954 RepID=A0A9D4ICJ0_DREPO|nr:hypothetical protein DPMN_170031 [Dreissena polymorpha]
MKTEKSVDNVKFRHMSSKQKPRPSAKSESASQRAASRHGRSRPKTPSLQDCILNRGGHVKTAPPHTEKDNALPMVNSVTSARSGTISHPHADLGMSMTLTVPIEVIMYIVMMCFVIVFLWIVLNPK